MFSKLHKSNELIISLFFKSALIHMPKANNNYAILLALSGLFLVQSFKFLALILHEINGMGGNLCLPDLLKSQQPNVNNVKADLYSVDFSVQTEF